MNVSRPAWPAVAVAGTLSWATMFAHNEANLPIPPWALSNIGPLLVTVALVFGYVARPGYRVFAVALLSWALLNAAGAILTVLPLPALPFVPDQTVQHYAWHALYLSGQVPLILVALRAARTPDVNQPTRGGRSHLDSAPGLGSYDERIQSGEQAKSS